MEKFVVTITRQFGSLGRPIAKKMSEILNVEYYDRDIVDMVAKETNLAVSTISDIEEKASKWAFMKFPLGNQTIQMQNQIFDVQKKIITELAEEKNCIIVGRCADYVLHQMPGHVSIYIYAPWEARYDNCIHALRMEPKEAAQTINDVDQARDAYHMKYAGYHPDDVRFKDILINSALLGVDGTAEYLSECIRKKFEKKNWL